jgi:hypothetical protein
MSDQAIHESTAIPTLSDAPPSSAGRSSPSHGGEQTQPTHEAISDELKARLDKVIYSDVSRHRQFYRQVFILKKIRNHINHK